MDFHDIKHAVFTHGVLTQTALHNWQCVCINISRIFTCVHTFYISAGERPDQETD